MDFVLGKFELQVPSTSSRSETETKKSWLAAFDEHVIPPLHQCEAAERDFYAPGAQTEIKKQYASGTAVLLISFCNQHHTQ